MGICLVLSNLFPFFFLHLFNFLLLHSWRFSQIQIQDSSSNVVSNSVFSIIPSYLPINIYLSMYLYTHKYFWIQWMSITFKFRSYIDSFSISPIPHLPSKKTPVFLSGILLLDLSSPELEASLFKSLFLTSCCTQIFGCELSHLSCLLRVSQVLVRPLTQKSDCLGEALHPLFEAVSALCVPRFPLVKRRYW